MSLEEGMAGVTFCDFSPCFSLLFSWPEGRHNREALAAKLHDQREPNLTCKRRAKNLGPRDYGGFRHR